MRVYVIGKYEEKAKIRTLMLSLAEAGHDITHDWTREDAGRGTGAERLRNLRRRAQADYQGVRDAEAVIVLHHPQLCGGLVEFGVAAADPSKILCVIGSQDPVARRHPIFYWLPEVRFFESESSLLRFLEQVSKEGWELPSLDLNSEQKVVLNEEGPGCPFPEE